MLQFQWEQWLTLLDSDTAGEPRPSIKGVVVLFMPTASAGAVVESSPAADRLRPRPRKSLLLLLICVVLTQFGYSPRHVKPAYRKAIQTAKYVATMGLISV
jgi:hypothetical protein